MNVKELSGIISNVAFIEQLWEGLDQADDASWRGFLQSGQTIPHDVNHNERFVYQQLGHLQVKLDPLGLQSTSSITELPWNTLLSKKFQKAYSGRIAYEFCYIENYEEKLWWQNKIEDQEISVPQNEMTQAIQVVANAVTFEEYMHKKFVGMKRFSIEGCESFIGALQLLIECFARQNYSQVVIGMAHRGRLAVLSEVLSKAKASIFKLCIGEEPLLGKQLDVKYHLGFSNTIETTSRRITVSLLANPSHLESINSVVLGFTKAQQDLKKSVVPVLVHGDAALAGQGSVMESLSLCGLEGYNIGGAIHFVINNQIGFTATANETRSTRYCTAIAKMIDAPVLHINCMDLEAVLYATKLAAEYRATFAKDIFVDLVCYRKHGHNEADEPSYTQPLMYDKIKSIDTILNSSRAPKETQKKELDEAYDVAISSGNTTVQSSKEVRSTEVPGIGATTLKAISCSLTTIPGQFNVHPRLMKQLQARHQTVEQGTGIDWATAESLAIATLLLEGHNIRFTGQDVCRGTFSQRHSVLIDQKTESKYIPLSKLNANGRFAIHNSNLSEFGVLGFEYGYSIGSSDTMVIWEAQFGDFANGAQVIIDQYIASSETKWGVTGNLILLLPHGYEGQGPEHSSARLERFLQLSADHNWTVCNCSTPASFFHLLRKQSKSSKPLIVMTPKSLLRHKEAVSAITDMDGDRKFESVICDKIPAQTKALILCSGKIYYDLQEIPLVAIARLEQLYPFPAAAVKSIIEKLQLPIIYVQEEPQNMGALSFVKQQLEECLKEFPSNFAASYLARPPSSSPATGVAQRHKQEQQDLINQILQILHNLSL